MLRNLVFNEEFLRKVVPFIKPEYFENINQIIGKKVKKTLFLVSILKGRMEVIKNNKLIKIIITIKYVPQKS